MSRSLGNTVALVLYVSSDGVTINITMISSQNSMVLGNGLGDKEGASTRAMIL
jgi:hypothetical protein